MLCLPLSAAFCVANGVTVTFRDGLPITIIKGSDSGGPDKSGSMSAYINGHTLTIAFTENLGQIVIEVRDESDVTLDLALLGTPTGYQCHIPSAGQ